VCWTAAQEERIHVHVRIEFGLSKIWKLLSCFGEHFYLFKHDPHVTKFARQMAWNHIELQQASPKLARQRHGIRKCVFRRFGEIRCQENPPRRERWLLCVSCGNRTFEDRQDRTRSAAHDAFTGAADERMLKVPFWNNRKSPRVRGFFSLNTGGETLATLGICASFGLSSTTTPPGL
jgi:hypothetical protein